MKIRLFLLTNLFLVAHAANAAERKSSSSIDTTGAFTRLKELAGEWEADTPMGKAHLTYTVIAGGTAVMEREHAEKMPEMLTVYHMDGQRLLLTHYCMANNQPRMEAKSYDPATGELKFRFLDATNMSSPAAGHMHNATFQIVDANHVKQNWQFNENGQTKMNEAFEYTRVR